MSYFLQTLEPCSLQTISIDQSPSFHRDVSVLLSCLTEDELFLHSRDGIYLVANWKRGLATPFFGQIDYETHVSRMGMIILRQTKDYYEYFLQPLNFLSHLYTGQILHRDYTEAWIPCILFQNTSPFFNGYGVIRYRITGSLWHHSTKDIPDMTVYIPTFEGLENQLLKFNVPDPLVDKITFKPFVYRSLPADFSHFADLLHPWLPYGESRFLYPTSPSLHYIVQSYNLPATPYLSLGVDYVTQDRQGRRAIFCASPLIRDAYLLDLGPVHDQIPDYFDAPAAGVLWLGRTRTYLHLACFGGERSGADRTTFCKSFYRIEFPALACYSVSS